MHISRQILWILKIFIYFKTFQHSVCYTASDIDRIINGQYDLKDSMRQQEGGKFTIGINDPRSNTGEYPVRATEVKPFYMDIYPVTVAQFWKYKIKKKNYRTSAEINGFSWVLSTLVSDLVKEKWSSESADPWWLAVKGAQWDRPEGPGSTAKTRLDYPVVHVSYQDAKAYCQWAGKRLPLEEEWEFATRGQLQGLQYPWGDKFRRLRMNTWQGKFPDEDKGYDGWKGLSPVDAYPPQNDNGMYDMLGNVWEWTNTRYYERVVDRKLQDVRYVLKGGSYMDTRDGSFNYVVRTSNRIGHMPKYTAHNVGFRCAASAPHLVSKMREKMKAAQSTTKRPPKLHRLEEMAYPPSQKPTVERNIERAEEL